MDKKITFLILFSCVKEGICQYTLMATEKNKTCPERNQGPKEDPSAVHVWSLVPDSFREDILKPNSYLKEMHCLHCGMVITEGFTVTLPEVAEVTPRWLPLLK